jgi:DNA helicase-2/ATP-dependent DNA helicase PcrA
VTITQLLDILFPPGSPHRPTPDQERIIRHPSDPAWVLAGPGSGKTEVLTILVLRLLYVQADPVQASRAAPESIFVTTFTEKAARNLEDRISAHRARITTAVPSISTIDISKLRIGTLHGLCNDLLQEFRAPSYQNVRLMDAFEQALFVYEHMSIVRVPNPAIDHAFWTQFAYLFKAYEWQPVRRYLPSKWNQADALVTLFNRIVEDRVSVAGMRAAGGQWARLADLYEEYAGKLQSEYRCDFAHLQARFLDFLQTPLGQHFRDGREGEQSGIRWVLVDEYQDTNLMQEEIYLTLANRQPHNIVVVGDDDQALYRFRGGSVECMVSFDRACHSYLGLPSTTIARYPLADNFRSHPQIVIFSDQYITAFPSMALPGARVPGKAALSARSGISGAYPAVGQLRAASVGALADRFGDTVRDLVANGVVRDYSQCCLLLKSTKETPHNAEPYVAALTARGVAVYNPRNKAFLEQEEVQALLGAMSTLIDPQGRNIPPDPRDLATMLADVRAEYGRHAPAASALANYVARCTAQFAANPGAYVNANLQEIVYFILSLPPFDQWQADPARRVRLGRLTALIESYTSMPVLGHPGVSRGRLRTSSANPGEILDAWVRSFYFSFFGYLSRSGLDEEEDEDVICPLGMVPVMTMHQAKGLQFPFVFVGHMNANSQVSAAHQLETSYSRFPGNPARAFALLPERVRAELDLIRQFYVAYSRAQYALILMGTDAHFKAGRPPCGPNSAWIRTHTPPL